MPRVSSKDIPSKETTVTTITVNEDLHKKVKHRAVEDGCSASSIYEEGAKLLLFKTTKKRKTNR